MQDSKKNNRNDFYQRFCAHLTKNARDDCRYRAKNSFFPLPAPSCGMTACEVADAMLLTISEGAVSASQSQLDDLGVERSDATQTLVAAAVQMLWDWFLNEDVSCHGVFTLLDMVDFTMRPDYMSPLDLLFAQIETGRRYIKSGKTTGDETGIDKSDYYIMRSRSSRNDWDWQPSKFTRRDGARPAEHTRPDGHCGMAPEEDAALCLYIHYKKLAAEHPLQTSAEIVQVRNALAKAFDEDEIAPAAVREYLQTKESIMAYQNSTKQQQQMDATAERDPEINAFERFYVASLKLAIEATNVSDAARPMYRQMLESELTELASANSREA